MVILRFDVWGRDRAEMEEMVNARLKSFDPNAQWVWDLDVTMESRRVEGTTTTVITGEYFQGHCEARVIG